MSNPKTGLPSALEVLLALAGLVVGVPLISFALMVVVPWLLPGSGIVLVCFLVYSAITAKGPR